MKSFVRTFLLAGIFGVVWWAFWFGRGNGFWPALWSGVIPGIILGLIVATIARYRENRVADSPPALMDEVVVYESRANHGGMAGWLYLTNRRLLFEGYPDDQTAPEISTIFDRFPADAEDAHAVSVPVLQIADAIPRFPGIDPRLDIVLTDGRTLRFGVEDTAEWLDQISTSRQKFLDETQPEDKKLFP